MANATMTAADFTAPVQEMLDAALPRLRGRVYSDIIDDAGHQYIDLVMGGGGVLGIALVGYTYALEQAGIRFLRVGGTSAGSINALALAGLDTMANAKSERLIEHLANLDVWSFVDGPPAARALVKDFLHQNAVVWKAINGAWIYHHFVTQLGLNPGHQFQAWLSDIMKGAGIATAAQLAQRMQIIPAELRTRAGRKYTAEDADAYLAVVATDISTETKVVLPKMANLYWSNADAMDPAVFVRASMSIPFFFEPLRIANVPQGADANARWKDMLHNDRFPPTECSFVDGGVLSNFPIDLFHDPTTIPNAPTFGVKLGTDTPPPAHIDRVVQLVMAVFNSARHSLDSEFLSQNPDYSALTCAIDTGLQSWLNFDLQQADKIDLFGRGVRAGLSFLGSFEWEKYKEIRKGIAHAHSNGRHRRRQRKQRDGIKLLTTVVVRIS